jgi:hypothetical protein
MIQKPKSTMRWLVAPIAALAGIFLMASIVSAAYYDDAMEFERWPGGGKYTLTLLSQCPGNRSDPACRCDKDDQRYRINASTRGSRRDWKLWSDSWFYQRTPTRRTIYGFGFDSSTPHLCVGKGEFWLGWSKTAVAEKIFVWSR